MSYSMWLIFSVDYCWILIVCNKNIFLYFEHFLTKYDFMSLFVLLDLLFVIPFEAG